ncbi:hypothetical protein, conserved [Trypanosoma brucei brucei TREU927]|uniref:Ankyrin repeat protein n=1 Tax=Trypanosoma brucei brucei (strain 927/4 GUTat10.1) TaxID=185431 RepID=Q57XU5_TRYB2|nr:hypothetical protein, conserved [Trypanosoma brucei brucei TREU927]AAX69574.1 hypothetical protein, conserved [Trypanosoma brucei]AAZ12786.1 hypothetical protein, conserved [Trypanosoma brucei brucei TREU927]
MPPRPRPRMVEDPNNTWNSQLMRACLQNDISEADKVVCNGADPSAPEPVPFHQTPVPPLIALLLRGLCNAECVATMKWLVERGADVSQRVPMRDRDETSDTVEEGTILHLILQMGQLPLLLQVLALVGEPRPLPVSFIRRVCRMDPALLGMAAQCSGGSLGKSNTASSSAYPPNNWGRSLSPVTSKRGARKASRLPVELPFIQQLGILSDVNPHLDGVLIDFNARSSVNGWTAMDIALRRKDAAAVELLLYYGAPCTFHRLVNANQTLLARACSQGDKELVEILLDAGDDLWHVSMDGRYTLIHYAVAHPVVLDLLLARGLSIDAENALGESALVSLICYGQGCNGEHGIRDAVRPLDAVRLASLPGPAVKNYILAPQTTSTAGSASRHPKPSTAAGNAADTDCPGVPRDADAWWHFLPGNCSTWELIQTLCDREANVHGNLAPIDSNRLIRRSAENKRTTMVTHQYEVGATSSPWLLPDFKKGSLVPSLPTSPGTSRDDVGLSAASPAAAASTTQTNQSTPSRQLGNSRSDQLLPTVQQVGRMTPLMHAIVAHHPELIRRFIVDYRVDPMVQDAQGACALHYGAIALHPSVMELLLSHINVNPEKRYDINVQDCCGRTPLHYAAMYGNTSVVRLLLNSTSGNSNAGAGSYSLNAAQPSKTDHAGRTALHLAVLARQLDVVEILLHHSESAAVVSNADTSVLSPHSQAPATKRRQHRTGSGFRRRYRQPAASSEPVAGDTVAHSLDVEARDTALGFTALEMAVRETHDVEAARLLLNLGVACVRHASGMPSGGTLLHRTVAQGMLPMLQVLLEYYADPNEVDDIEQTPLFLATQSTLPVAVDMVRELLSFKATVEVQSGHTLETPLIIAARRGRADMVDLLLHQRQDSRSGRRLGAYTARRSRGRFGNHDNSNNTTVSSHTPPNHNHPVSVLNLSMQSRSRHSISSQQRLGDRPKKSVNTPRNRRGGRQGKAGARTQSSARANQQKQQKSAERDASSVSATSDVDDEVFNAGQNAMSEGVNINLAGTTGTTAGAANSCCEYSVSSLDSEGNQPPVLTVGIHHLLCTDKQVRTALHHLCSHSDPVVQQELLPHIRDVLSCTLAQTLVLQVDAMGRLPIHDACASGFADAVTELLNHDTGNCAFFLDARGSLPLHYAVTADSEACLRALLRNVNVYAPCTLRGASTTVEDPRVVPITQRILTHHRGTHYSKVTCVLRDEGCRENHVETVWDYLNVYDGMGRTPLVLAAELGRCRVAKFLTSLLKQRKTHKQLNPLEPQGVTVLRCSSSSSIPCDSTVTACMLTAEPSAINTPSRGDCRA